MTAATASGANDISRHQVGQKLHPIDLHARIRRHGAERRQIGADAWMQQRIHCQAQHETATGRGIEPGKRDDDDPSEDLHLAPHLVNAEGDRGKHQRNDQHPQRFDEGLRDRQQLLWRRSTISASGYGAAPANSSWRAKARHPRLARLQRDSRGWRASARHDELPHVHTTDSLIVRRRLCKTGRQGADGAADRQVGRLSP